jgi:hypothetical protein
MVEWQSLLRNAADDGTIRLAALRKIPQLKTCDNWKEVVFLGRVHHATAHVTYDGGLVKLGQRIYYISRRQIDVVAKFARFRNLDRHIAVVE